MPRTPPESWEPPDWEQEQRGEPDDEGDEDEGPSDRDLDEFAADDEGDATDDTEPCPVCRRPVWHDAEQCPHCGHWLAPGWRSSGRRRPWVRHVAVLLLVAFGVSILLYLL